MTTVTEDKVGEDTGASSKENAPRSGGSAAANRQAEILAAFAAHTEVEEMSPLWRFLKPTSEVRRLACSPAELVQLLSEQFTTAELLGSGLLKEKDGTLHLSPVFGGSGKSLFVVPENAKTPGEIFSTRGTIRGASELRNYALAENTSSNQPVNRILLAGDERDFQFLTTLGLRPLLVSSLAKFRGKIFSKMFRQDANYKYTFIVVGWQIAGLNKEPNLQTLIGLGHLWRVANVYGHDVEARFAVWRADGDMTDRLRDAAHCADKKAVLDLVTTAATKLRSSPVDFYQDLDSARDVDLVTARSQLMRAIANSNGSSNSAALNRITNRYRRAIEKACVEPHFVAAAQASDPLDGTLHVVGAWLTQHVLETDPLLQAVHDIQQGRAPSVDWTRDPDALAETIGVKNALIGLKKVLKKSA